MAWLVEWKRLLRHPNVHETFTASCSYGSPFQKEFRFLTANMWPESICIPCSRDHLGAAEKVFQKFDINAEGLESVLTHEVARHAPWKVSSSWKWRGRSRALVLTS